ncbi:DUF3842 family protein [Peptacetobacter sp.]|uniref:DUF3842 family protein n=1 Tax=Peptacetobacter sp. TaxID=2991975 RepID=UPI00260F4932|nr:DUF3842 family protein [Peptacetobacter sp.]
MKVLIIDAQGGGIGKQLIIEIKKNFPKAVITAVGTNSTATTNMLKAGADHAATGENAVIVACRKAEIIIGPIGIVIADSMYGEITPKMSEAIGQSNAEKLLIPMNHCNNIIVGIENKKPSFFISSVVEELKKYFNC